MPERHVRRTSHLPPHRLAPARRGAAPRRRGPRDDLQCDVESRSRARRTAVLDAALRDGPRPRGARGRPGRGLSPALRELAGPLSVRGGGARLRALLRQLAGRRAAVDLARVLQRSAVGVHEAGRGARAGDLLRREQSRSAEQRRPAARRRLRRGGVPADREGARSRLRRDAAPHLPGHRLRGGFAGEAAGHLRRHRARHRAHRVDVRAQGLPEIPHRDVPEP